MSIRSPWIPRIILAAVIAAISGTILSIAVGEDGPERVTIGGVNDVQRIFGGIEQEGAFLGDEDAPVTITLFNDIQCGVCADYQVEEIDPLVEEYVRTGQARLELIHVSVSSRMFTLTALAATAAGLQDRQWQYADTFVRNFDTFGETIDEETLLEVAEAVQQFEVETWEADLDDEEVQQIVDADAQLAIDAEVGDEPGVIVSGPEGEVELLESPSREEIELAIAEVG